MVAADIDSDGMGLIITSLRGIHVLKLSVEKAAEKFREVYDQLKLLQSLRARIEGDSHDRPSD